MSKRGFMKYLLISILLVILIAISGCESTSRTIFDPDAGAGLPEPASIIRVIYSSGVNLVAPATVSFETRLDRKYPCYVFSHFEEKDEGAELYIKAYVKDTEQPCTSTDPNIVRNFSHRFENPGKYLVHFYISEQNAYNIEIDIGE